MPKKIKPKPRDFYNDSSSQQDQSQSSEEEQEQEHLENKTKRKSKPTVPRFFKHTLDSESDHNNIYINVSQCHYPIVQKVAKELGWIVDESPSSTNWDVFWTDRAIQTEHLFRLLSHQKINHFPGMYILARKNCLGRALMKMRKQIPEEYDFFPLTWTIPSELNEFSRYYESAKGENKQQTFIIKPQASCQGRGIILTRKIEIIQDQQPCVVQKYITKPFLIGGLKFDFRIYVLLAGSDPLRIFIYKEGLVRFATTQYQEPESKNLKESYMHLTNYAINKDNPRFVFNKSSQQGDVGHKRSLSSVFKLLQSTRVDVLQLKKKINDIVIKTIITGQPLLSHLYQLSQPDNYANDMCFQILGLDIIIQGDCQPKLLEVNHTPSFVTDTPLDESIKKNCIRDALILMNINKETKKAKIGLKMQKEEMRGQKQNTKLNPKEKVQMRVFEEKRRGEYESENLGDYEKIYPTTDKESMKKYKKLLEISDRLFNHSHIKRKKTITTTDEAKTEKNSPTKMIRMRTQLEKEQSHNIDSPSHFPILHNPEPKLSRKLGQSSDKLRLQKPSTKDSVKLEIGHYSPEVRRKAVTIDMVADHKQKKLKLERIRGIQEYPGGMFPAQQVSTFSKTFMRMQKIKNLSLGLLNDVRLAKIPVDCFLEKLKTQAASEAESSNQGSGIKKKVGKSEILIPTTNITLQNSMSVKPEKRNPDTKFMVRNQLKETIATQHRKLLQYLL